MGMRRPLPISFILVLAGCASDALPPDSTRPDFAVIPDLAVTPPEPDLYTELNECGDREPNCTCLPLAVPFPLSTDPMPLPGVENSGVKRDVDGTLILGPPPAPPNVVWIANSYDLHNGTISKIDGPTIREVARYFSVTCGSNPEGSTAMCDGKNGCCARDDLSRYLNRAGGRTEGARQAVTTMSLYPSRTAVDVDGNVFVVNRAGTYPTVTRIANKPSDCVDRNKNGRIDTSADVDKDGLIRTDCNNDGVPDDIASVKQKPCANNLPQEFYGLDDECVLWTTNFDDVFQKGGGVALGVSGDLWTTTSASTSVHQLDPATGRLKMNAVLPPDCWSDSIAIDASGIGWTSALTNSTTLCFFDTRLPVSAGRARTPPAVQAVISGLSIDRDGNVWSAAYRSSPAAFRYTPDRSAFIKLGKGTWTEFTDVAAGAGARGVSMSIAVDARNPKADFAWLTAGANAVARIPATANPPRNVDQVIDGTAYTLVTVGGGSNVTGIALDIDGNAWAVASVPGVVTRVRIDGNGVPSNPNIASPPNGNNRCPAGDTCALKDGNLEPFPAAFSTFTPYNAAFANAPASGRYSYTFDASSFCPAPSFRRLDWTSDVPAATTLTVRARPAPGPAGNFAWEGPFDTSPRDISIDVLDGKLQVEFNLQSKNPALTPRVSAARACFKCP